MRTSTLLRHSLFYQWRSNLAVVLGVIVGTAVLTGALLVGDSLRGSLRALTLERLGRIDHALVSERFFGADLAELLDQHSGQGHRAEHIAAIMLRGSTLVRDAQGQVVRRVGQVQVVGIEPRFWRLFAQDRPDLENTLLINTRLAEELQLGAGDLLEVRLEKPQAVPADSILGRPIEDAGITLEASPVAEVLADREGGRFSLSAQQQFPRIVYVQLGRLQNRLRDSLQSRDRANVLLLATHNGAPGCTARLQQDLAAVVRLEDHGLHLRSDPGGQRYLSLESRRLLLEPVIVDTIVDLGKQSGWLVTPTLTYLANRISRGERFVPYSTIVGIDPQQEQPFGKVALVDGTLAPRPNEDEILVNEWLAEDLWPAGDWRDDLGKPVVTLTYFVEGDDWLLKEETVRLKLAGVVRLAGLAADRTLTPDFPGIRGTSVRDWKPPFPKEQWHPEWVRDRDEEYWRQHRATPKAFVSPTLAQKLWKSRHGEYTSVRIAPGLSVDKPDLKQMEAELRRQLATALPPERLGLLIQPVREQGLAAAGSSTAEMFGWLFMGFSVFLIGSAAMLVGLLFRLGIERRATEMGLLYAVGYPKQIVRRLVLGEGAIIAGVGALIGLAAAVGYAALLLAWLRGSWSDTLQTSFLQLHVAVREPMFGPLPYPSLVLGFLLSVGVAFGAMLWSLRSLAHVSPRSLLAGKTHPEGEPGLVQQQRSFPWLVGGGLLLACALALASLFVPTSAAAPMFFISGALLLASGLAGWRRWLRRPHGAAVHGQGDGAILRLGARNAERAPGRSLLTAGLLASATFLVVAVESFRKSSGPDALERNSGTGGFTLLALADVPMVQPPDSAKHLQALLPQADAALLRGAENTLEDVQMFGLRVRPGDDVSCLNLYQPQQPRIVGVPRELRDRGGFAFASLHEPSPVERQNPWRLLERMTPNEVPVLAADHTAQWVLLRSPGDTWTITDERGQEVTLRLVGLLRSSIFQSELLMSEENFRRHFPSRGGYAYFLIEAPAARTHEVKQTLEVALGERYGLNVEKSLERLAAFQAVENTYLSTFQALGGLGVLLGTAGLAVVLLRNVWERQGELALLRALGYAPRDLGLMVVAENALLVLVGLGLGIMAALVAVLPHLIERAQSLPWAGILGLVLLVLAFGLGAGLVALVTALRAPLLPALRRE
jgi:ABC-type lipoprotein release transport system permease subunit